MKKKYTLKQRKQLLHEWRVSGKSAPKWCQEMGISYTTLAHWRQTLPVRKQKKCQRKSPSFVELVESPKPAQNYIEVACADVVIRLFPDFDDQVFLRCLQTLKRL